MLWLALKTLLYERVRFLITLLGITVSTVLTIAEVAIYLGMMANATAVVRHTDADIWIASKNIQSFDFAQPFPEQRINAVRGYGEVLWADKIMLSYGFLKLRQGGYEQVQIVGFNPDSGVGSPWAMVVGHPAAVKGGQYMIIDKTSEQRLGRLEPGTLWELTFARAHAFRLVGLSEGIKSFTTIPMVFISYNQFAELLAEMGWPGQTAFIVAKARPGADLDALVRALRARLRNNDVYTTREFIGKTVRYWTVQTGMGMAFFLTGVLSLAIGGAVVGQTVYASTLEHLREYGTLKAIGAHNREIYQVIFVQAGASAVGGFLAASLVVLLLRGGFGQAGVPVYLHPLLFAGVFVLTLLVCLMSAYFSVRKVSALDPVTVFKA